MLLQIESPIWRTSSTSDELVSTPRSPTSAALLEHDLQYINEQTQSLLADKLAAEQRYACLLQFSFGIAIVMTVSGH